MEWMKSCGGPAPLGCCPGIILPPTLNFIITATGSGACVSCSLSGGGIFHGPGGITGSFSYGNNTYHPCNVDFVRIDCGGGIASYSIKTKGMNCAPIGGVLTILSCSPFHAVGSDVLQEMIAPDSCIGALAAMCGGFSDGDTVSIEITE